MRQVAQVEVQGIGVWSGNGHFYFPEAVFLSLFLDQFNSPHADEIGYSRDGHIGDNANSIFRGQHNDERVETVAEGIGQSRQPFAAFNGADRTDS